MGCTGSETEHGTEKERAAAPGTAGRTWLPSPREPALPAQLGHSWRGKPGSHANAALPTVPLVQRTQPPFHWEPRAAPRGQAGPGRWSPHLLTHLRNAPARRSSRPPPLLTLRTDCCYLLPAPLGKEEMSTRPRDPASGPARPPLPRGQPVDSTWARGPVLVAVPGTRLQQACPLPSA